MELLKDAMLENRDGEAVSVDFSGKVTALYFSAGWCPPCRRFTPLLKELHDELTKRKAPFVLVFVSLDESAEDMRRYMDEAHGDWMALPFGNPIISGLREKYHIELVPKLLVLKDDGSIITTNGRKEVQDKGVAAFRLWQDAAHLTRPLRPHPNMSKVQENQTT